MDVYETGLVVQRPPLWAAESEKTMDNTTQDKQAFYRELQGRQVFIPCRKQGDENITLELLVSNQGEQMIPAFYERGSAKGKFDEASLVDADGKLTAKTALKQCKYASRTWTKGK